MAQFKNPFEKQPTNPFVDPVVAQNQHSNYIQSLNEEDVPAVQGKGGGGSGAWGTGLWNQTSNVAYNQAQQQTHQMQPPKDADTVPQKSPGNGWGSWTNNNNQSKAPPEIEGEATKVLSQREKDLQKRELDYQKRQKELKNLEVDMQKSGIDIKKKNFPPLIPLVYHNISKEIPQEQQGLLRRVFFVWLGFILCNVFNFIAVCVGFGGFGSAGQIFAFILAAGYMVAAVPLSWFLWYRRLYNSMKNNGVVGFVLFFVFGGFAIIFCIWQAIGPPVPGFIPGGNQASAGVVQAIKLLIKSGAGAKVAGIFYIVAAVLWAVEALAFLVVYIQVMRNFRGSGGQERVQRGAQIVGSLAQRMDQV